MNHRRSRRGFTIVELMLSMTFISVMLVAIALCIIQLSKIYTRGETLRQMNQASRVVSIDMRRTFAEASPPSIVDRSDVGRLCTGQYSYIWNSGRKDAPKFVNNKYKTGGTVGDPVRLVRVVDSDAKYCADADPANPSATNVNSPIETSSATYTELLQEGERQIQIHKLTVTQSDLMNLIQQRLYRIDMILGTETSDVIETVGDATRCRVPSQQESYMEYCAINEISFTVRAGMR